jgi:serine/threonine protein kinase/formylglycine-generating enzyme required for sulfatase activity
VAGDNSGTLNATDWARLQGHTDRFEKAWKAGGPADPAQFLPPPGDPLRAPCLLELVKIDLEMRWRGGQPVVLDHYVEKFPELGPAQGLPVSLVAVEYLVRLHHGDRPALTLYQKRFPEQYEALQGLVLGRERPGGPAPATGPTVPPGAPAAAGAGGLGKGSLLSMAGGYELLERIGVGGFGEVWRAQAPGGVLAAVKIIFRPVDHEAARQELDALELIKKLRHHFLLSTHAFWAFEDRLVIAMDLADGSLRDRLKACKAEGKAGVPVEELLLYSRETAEALDYLHAKGVLHRDIKPENLLLAEGHVRVADFGLARLHQTMRSANASGSGTPLYMPPEFWRERVSLHSDQYSFAASYFELRTGRRLFETRALLALMTAHLEQTPDLSPLGEAEQQVLRRALAKDPAKRFPSCVEFVSALNAAVRAREQAPVAPPPGAGPPSAEQHSWNADTDLETRLPGRETVPNKQAGDAPTAPDMPAWRPRPAEKRPAGLVLALVAGALMVALAGWFFWPPTPPDGQPPPPEKKQVPQATFPESAAGKYRAVAAAGSRKIGGKDYPREVECVLPEGPAVRFLLVHSEARKDVAPFYLMRDKVTNELFAAFASRNPGAVREPQWQLGGRAAKWGVKPGMGIPACLAWLGAPRAPAAGLAYFSMLALVNQEREDASEYLPHLDDLGSHNGRLPVLRVWIEDADRCARWLGGQLPSEKEWDVAAGRWEKDAGEGPFESPWKEGEIAVKRSEKGPLPVGTAVQDRSKFSGCSDLAGNGFEWTRSYTFNFGDPGELTGPGQDLSRLNSLKFILRGQSYAAEAPLTYKSLAGVSQTQPYDRSAFGWHHLCEIGFRVALPAQGFEGG